MLADRLVCVFLLTTHVCLASGSYIVEVNVHNYQNPSGRCAECQWPWPGRSPGCCDEDFIRPASQGCPGTGPMAAVCDPFITYCSVPLGDPTCNPNTEGSMSAFFRPDTNSIDFDAEGSLLGTELPLTIEGDEPWRGLEFVFEPMDCTVTMMKAMLNNCGSRASIDKVFIDIDIPVGTSSPEQTYIGDAGNARFNVSYSVRCAVDHYGADCTRECTNFVSCEGCGLPGLTGEFCQFPANDCDDMYCNSNGQCEDGSPTCDCELGYTGELCETIDDCEGENCSGNGRCEDRVNSFVCICEPGFTGDLCEQLIMTSVITSVITSEGEATYSTRIPSSELDVAALTGGVVGATVFVVLIAIIVVLVVIIILQKKTYSNDAVSQQSTNNKIEMTRNQLYGVRTTEEDIKMEPVYEIVEENNYGDDHDYEPVEQSKVH